MKRYRKPPPGKDRVCPKCEKETWRHTDKAYTCSSCNFSLDYYVEDWYPL